MKLTKHHSLDEFAAAVRIAALQNAAYAGCPDSYAAAFGGIQHLLFTICQKHPKALALVNDYIARYEAKAAESAQPVAKTRLSSDHVAAEVQKHAREERRLMSKLTRRGPATHAPAATPAPAVGMAAASHAAGAAPAPTAAPSEDAPPAATPPAVPDPEATAHAPSSADTQNPAPCAAAPRPAPPAPHPSEGTPQPAASASQERPALPDSLHPTHSSAHAGEACGDINCDGKCGASSAARANHPPALIQLIDVSPTVNDARIATADATPAALRAAARFLRTDMHSLPAVIQRRVRERLAKAA